MPGALDWKYPNAPKEWLWQRVLPQETRWKNTVAGEEGRHHTHETILQRAVKEAIRKAGVVSSTLVVTHSVTPLLRAYLRLVMIFARYRNFLATKTSARR